MEWYSHSSYLQCLFWLVPYQLLNIFNILPWDLSILINILIQPIHFNYCTIFHLVKIQWIYQPVDGCLGYFQLFTIKYEAAVKSLEDFLCTYENFFSIFIKVKLCVCKVKYVLLSRVIVPIYALTKEYENIGFSVTFSFLSLSLFPPAYAFQHFCYYFFKKFANMMDMKLYLVL